MSTAAGFEARWFSGEALHGDDFGPTDIARWFDDEREAYAQLYGADEARHDYGYAALNHHHAFSQLPSGQRFRHALGFGSNFGDELAPLLDRLAKITLLDASEQFVVHQLRGVPVQHLMARADGRIALPDAAVDLITCFGVLHHIPNVSAVLCELARVLAPGGWLLLREPTTTMGDWRQPRAGLTARERGIPPAWLVARIEAAGLRVGRVSDCYFPPWVRLCLMCRLLPFKHRATTWVDALLSRLTRSRHRYHRSDLASRFAPASRFVLAQRPAPSV